MDLRTTRFFNAATATVLLLAAGCNANGDGASKNTISTEAECRQRTIEYKMLDGADREGATKDADYELSMNPCGSPKFFGMQQTLQAMGHGVPTRDLPPETPAQAELHKKLEMYFLAHGAR